jgi:hypothetical protein
MEKEYLYFQSIIMDVINSKDYKEFIRLYENNIREHSEYFTVMINAEFLYFYCLLLYFDSQYDKLEENLEKWFDENTGMLEFGTVPMAYLYERLADSKHRYRIARKYLTISVMAWSKTYEFPLYKQYIRDLLSDGKLTYSQLVALSYFAHFQTIHWSPVSSIDIWDFMPYERREELSFAYKKFKTCPLINLYLSSYISLHPMMKNSHLFMYTRELNKVKYDSDSAYEYRKYAYYFGTQDIKNALGGITPVKSDT